MSEVASLLSVDLFRVLCLVLCCVKELVQLVLKSLVLDISQICFVLQTLSCLSYEMLIIEKIFSKLVIRRLSQVQPIFDQL
jgi:hypothetical protein